MDRPLVEHKNFEKTDFTAAALPPGEYEDCGFTQCNFSETALSGIYFSECRFAGCNLSMVQLKGTAFRDCVFIDCKLLGLHWEDCNQFGLSFHFEGCILDLCSFFKLKLKAISFKDCSLQEADLREADLSKAVFDRCNLQGAMFDHTNLEGADLRTAEHYTIDPAQNKIKKARFSMPGVIRLLDKYQLDIG
ncbi:MAG: pentapeptide repeat-containing protein [Chitinophagaceae bacterium]|nr:pentapeptide repeat-containing protein [Chitinophagaceae bacterium]